MTYILGSLPDEEKRLLTQANIFDRTTQLFLNGIIRPGQKVIEIGPGTGGASCIIAKLLAGQGTLTLLEKEHNYVDFLQQRLQINGIEKNNINILQKDFLQHQPTEEFDVLYGRAILHHIPQAFKAIETYIKQMPSGGLVVFEEPIMSSTCAFPSSPAYQQLTKLYLRLAHCLDIDLLIGKKLATEFSKMGLKVIKHRWTQEALLTSTERNMLLGWLNAITPALLSNQIVEIEEVTKLHHQLQALVESNATILYIAFGQVVAQKV